jgi:cation diffusion facilitator CzcD-associated flavoprotein CzcO
MLNIKDLSFWEKSLYFESLDFTIIGAGIVGLSTAIFLKEKFPRSKILILERGYLPSGASTKNAGFACFGSPTELYDDLSKISVAHGI